LGLSEEIKESSEEKAIGKAEVGLVNKGLEEGLIKTTMLGVNSGVIEVSSIGLLLVVSIGLGIKLSLEVFVSS